MNPLGTEIRRSDALGKASGQARYTEDFYPPGLLHGVVVRSPLASGGVRGLDVARARAVSGAVKVLTGAELPAKSWGTVKHDQPLLARDVVRFVGEPLAIVAAETKAAALEAAALVELDLEEREPVVGLDAALAKGAPEVHAGEPNLQPAATIARGDVDAAFAAAEHVVSTRHESHRVHQAYIEPRAALAELEEDRLIVTTTSQAPFVVRQGLAFLLDLPLSRIVVKVPALGGGFGGKLHMGLAALAGAMCLATWRPVQIVCSRTEDMQAANPRENSTIELESAVDADGRVRARRARILLDSGAYAMDTPSIASIAAMGATGPYSIEAVDLEARPVYTNTCPTGSFRGPSGPQMVWATEAHIEEIAARIGLDPVELRGRNLLRPGDRGPTGELMRDPGIADCLDAVVKRLERWRASSPPLAAGRRRGFGLACAGWLTTGSPSGATLAMNEDGSATLATGGTEIGTGAVASGVAAIVAAELDLPLDRVRVASGSTDNRPHDGGSKGSRTMYGAGNAAREAAREVAQILAREVAEHFEAAPDDIELADGRVGVRGSPEASLSIEEAVEIAFAATGPVVGKGRFKGAPVPLEGSTMTGMPFDAFNEPTFHCHGLELELEEETGRIEVIRYVAAHDVGPVLNPAGARGQVEGGVVQGLGYALTESVDLTDAGAMRNADLVDYRIPTIADVPCEIETVFVEEHPGPTGPHGAKGIGEPPVIMPAAAVGSALRDALGAQPDRLPFDAIRVSDFLERLALEADPAESAAPLPVK